MNQYQKMYNEKKMDVADALSCIKSGDELYYSCCAMTPFTLLENLHSLQGKVKDVNIVHGLDVATFPVFDDPTYADTFHTDSLFMMHYSREAFKKGMVSFVPIDLHNNAAYRFAYRKPDVLLCSATPMDEHGYLRCSLTQIMEQDLFGVCDRIIVEVNPNLPWVGGDTAFHISQVTSLIESARPIPVLSRSESTKEEIRIGEYISELVNDGDTIQLGIGGIPNAVGNCLLDKKDLGVHTELMTNIIADLVEAGVVTGRRKTLHHGKMIAAFAFGDEKLYKMMDRNPAVELLRGSYVNDPLVISQNDNMVSINTCISIDLTGQVNSESIGTRQFSGTGGQVDTVTGAVRAKNGRSIIALTSTALGGKVSSIVPILAPGAIVSLPRTKVDYVVTEYGVVRLKGRNIRDRVDMLISVAHPDFRDELRAEAKKYDIR